MKILLPFIILLIAFTGCTKKKDSGVKAETIIAIVNGEPITVQKFLVEYNRLNVSGKDDVESSTRKNALKKLTLNKLIMKNLLQQYARTHKLSVNNNTLHGSIRKIKEQYTDASFKKMLVTHNIDLEAWKERQREKLLIDRILNEKILQNVAVKDDEIESYYKKNRRKFKVPKKVRALQIIVASEEEAEMLLTKIKRGERFEDLARKHSFSLDAKKGGDLGYFARGDRIQVFDRAFKMSVGSVSRVFKSEYGYHIMKLMDRTPARRQNVSEVRDQIRSVLLEKRKEEVYNKWITRLLKNSKIYKNNLLLEKL